MPPTASRRNCPAACASAWRWRARWRWIRRCCCSTSRCRRSTRSPAPSCRARSRTIWSQEKKTVVMITNDVDEAILLADRIVPLNPGPDASFGPEFRVPFERPRDRSAMNSNPAYKKLRAAVTQYLMDVGARRADADTEERATAQYRAGAVRSGAAARLQGGRRDAVREALRRVLRGAQSLPDAERPADGGRRLRSADAQGRVRLADRPFRLRQVDRAVDDRRPQRRDQRRHRARQQGGDRRRPRPRGGVPEPVAVAVDDRARERRARRRSGLSARQQGRAQRHRQLLPRRASAWATPWTSAPPNSPTA